MEIWIILGFMIGFMLLVSDSYAFIAGAAILAVVAIAINKVDWIGIALVAGVIVGLSIEALENRRRRNRIAANIMRVFICAIIILVIARIAGYRIFY